MQFSTVIFLILCIISIQLVFFWIYTKTSILGTLFYASIPLTLISGIISISFYIKRKVRDGRKAKSKNASNTVYRIEDIECNRRQINQESEQSNNNIDIESLNCNEYVNQFERNDAKRHKRCEHIESSTESINYASIGISTEIINNSTTGTQTEYKSYENMVTSPRLEFNQKKIRIENKSNIENRNYEEIQKKNYQKHQNLENYPLPSSIKKIDLISSEYMFNELDRNILYAPQTLRNSIQQLIDYILRFSDNDLFIVRGIFIWIASNIVYDFKYSNVHMSSSEVLRQGAAVCAGYSTLFQDLCKLANINVKTISGFAKGYGYKIGSHFSVTQKKDHAWNAVRIFDNWYLIDVTWGSGHVEDYGKFVKQLNEHYFLTDPEHLIWTHFPYDENDNNYNRWQLLSTPLTLKEFNLLPKVNSNFFRYKLKLLGKLQNPINFDTLTTIKLRSQEPMEYLYHLYATEAGQKNLLDDRVFHEIKDNRMLASFTVFPPKIGEYTLEIYSKPVTKWGSLNNVITFHLNCNSITTKIESLPANDQYVWGPTKEFYDLSLITKNNGVVYVLDKDNNDKLDIESNEKMSIICDLYNSKHLKVNRNNVKFEQIDRYLKFSFNLSHFGFYKLMIYGKPESHTGSLPLLAIFLIENSINDKQEYSLYKHLLYA